MCENCKGCEGKKNCIMHVITKVLVIVGGINWGLVGVGMFLGKGSAWNLVSLIFGSMPIVEAIVYVLVGLAAVSMIFGCKCKTCTVPVDASPTTPNPTV